MFGRVVKWTSQWPPINIDAVDELRVYESAILERINKTPNGGVLFSLNPFLLFRDVGVMLTDRAAKDLRKRAPRLNRLDSEIYCEVRDKRVSPNVTVRVNRLFPFI